MGSGNIQGFVLIQTVFFISPNMKIAWISRPDLFAL